MFMCSRRETMVSSFSVRVEIKDVIGKDRVIKLPKWRKLFMPVVDTRGQQ